MNMFSRYMSDESTDDSTRPNPATVEYCGQANARARDRAIATGRYVTVEYGDDAPNLPNTIGLTYAPDGSYVINHSILPGKIEAIRRIVKLANLALDRGLG